MSSSPEVLPSLREAAEIAGGVERAREAVEEVEALDEITNAERLKLLEDLRDDFDDDDDPETRTFAERAVEQAINLVGLGEVRDELDLLARQTQMAALGEEVVDPSRLGDVSVKIRIPEIVTETDDAHPENPSVIPPGHAIEVDSTLSLASLERRILSTRLIGNNEESAEAWRQISTHLDEVERYRNRQIKWMEMLGENTEDVTNEELAENMRGDFEQYRDMSLWTLLTDRWEERTHGLFDWDGWWRWGVGTFVEFSKWRLIRRLNASGAMDTYDRLLNIAPEMRARAAAARDTIRQNYHAVRNLSRTMKINPGAAMTVRQMLRGNEGARAARRAMREGERVARRAERTVRRVVENAPEAAAAVRETARNAARTAPNTTVPETNRARRAAAEVVEETPAGVRALEQMTNRTKRAIRDAVREFRAGRLTKQAFATIVQETYQRAGETIRQHPYEAARMARRNALPGFGLRFAGRVATVEALNRSILAAMAEGSFGSFFDTLTSQEVLTNSFLPIGTAQTIQRYFADDAEAAYDATIGRIFGRWSGSDADAAGVERENPEDYFDPRTELPSWMPYAELAANAVGDAALVVGYGSAAVTAGVGAAGAIAARGGIRAGMRTWMARQVQGLSARSAARIAAQEAPLIAKNVAMSTALFLAIQEALRIYLPAERIEEVVVSNLLPPEALDTIARAEELAGI